MIMEFSFVDHRFDKLLDKVGITGRGISKQLSKVILAIVICWLPLVVITLIQGSFWTGNISDSFITNFDTQARFLVSLPILILSGKLISARLGLIVKQFKTAGILKKNEYDAFDRIIERALGFLKSKWTLIAIALFCYVQVFLVLFYKSENTSMLSWQMELLDGKHVLSLVGKWSTLISRPIVLFFFLRWLLRIVVWGWVLRKISLLDLNLFAVHPDLCGGLGFVGYALRFFSPIAFAISAAIAGYMVDSMLIEGEHLTDVRSPALAYLLFITLLFTVPLLSFTKKLIDAREKSVFENDDFANGMFREFRSKLSKSYDEVDQNDLKETVYSSTADLSAVMDNALNMKYIPFTLKDVAPLWVATAAPFLAVVIVDIPINELLKNVISFLV